MIKNIFMALFVLAISQFFTINVYAYNQNTYKTTTNNKIIYIIEENDSFSYSWQFDKADYRDGIDFSLNINNKSRNTPYINQYIIENDKVQFLSFEHHGVLPTKALMKIKAKDEFKDGDKLYLYYYNEVTKRLEFIDDNLMVKNGFVEFEIKHCSDYILTASIVKTAVNNPQSMTIIIISLLVLGVILVAGTLFINGKK